MLRGSAGPRHGAANPGLNASTSREINAAFATFVRERPDALFVGLDPFLNSRRAQLVNLASRHALPASSRPRTDRVIVMEIPVRMRQTRTATETEESQSALFCQAKTTSWQCPSADP
jgi:hypothetical protein